MRILTLIFFINLTVLCYGQVSINAIPDQVVGKGGSFESLDLQQFSSENVFWETEFVKPDQSIARPSWSVNATSFQFQMNLTAQVSSKGKDAIGSDHLLAVIDENQNIRGIASATKVGDNWVYFLTIYANNNGRALYFLFYDHKQEEILRAKEQITFSSNRVIGQPDAPYLVEAETLDLSLSNNLLTIEISDSLFVGTEKVVVTARSLTNPTDLARDTVKLTVVDNFAPQFSDIPDQTSEFGASFNSFDLDDYTTLLDSDEVSFSFSQNSELTITIDDDNVVSIIKPENWSGADTITFTVTDLTEFAFFETQPVVFRGKLPDQAPEIIGLNDQITGLQGMFLPIALQERVIASNPEAISWTVDIITDSAVMNPDWSVQSNKFQFNMSVTIAVNALGKRQIGNSSLVAAFSGKNHQLIGVNSATQVGDSWYYFLTINNNNESDSVYFKVYDASSSRVLPTNQTLTFSANAVLGDPLEPFELDAGYVFPKIEENILSFNLRKTNWTGSERIRLTATDNQTSGLLNDSDTFNLEKLDIRPPALASVNKKIVAEGNTFSNIDLAELLSNVDQSEVLWSIAGADTLHPILNGTIISFGLADENYYGLELLRVTATSSINANLFDITEIELQTDNINDAPLITSTPITTANLNELYRYDIDVVDYDNDATNIIIENLPDWVFYILTSNGGTLLGIPTLNNAGTYPVDITVSDGNLETTQSIVINVVSVSISDIPDQIIAEGLKFDTLFINDYLSTFGEIDITWKVSNGDELVATILDNEKLVVTIPDENWYGSESFTIEAINTANNRLLNATIANYSVVNVNDLPTIVISPQTNAIAGEAFETSVAYEDADNDQLTFVMNNAPSWIRKLDGNNGFTLFGIAEPSDNNSFTVSITDAMATIELSINIEVEVVLTFDSFSNIQVFPNPTSEYLYINSNQLIDRLTIYQLNGDQLVQLETVSERINISSWKQGAYIMKIESGQKMSYHRIIKK